MAGQHVVIPYAPRIYQKEIHTGMDSHRWGAAVCHRRFGKTVCAVNHLQRGAVTCPHPRPRFGYIAPTYTQGKAIAWDYMKHYASPIPSHGVHESELRIDYPNGGQARIFGADNPDSLRGLYFDGVVLDEYGLHPPNIFTEVIRPALADRGGWALFLGTPNGKNQFYRIIHGGDGFKGARHDPEWFFGEYRASMTGILSAAELAANRSMMTDDEYAQEFECSFEASVKGAVYAREMQAAREQGRIARVPCDPSIQVDTDWDIGVGDATAIWFSQSLYTGEVRLIDYYENRGLGLPHYKQVLNEKASRFGYAYGEHWAPHDIKQRELSTGHSRVEAAAQLGLHFRVLGQTPLDDGIHNARMLFGRCWFDADKCARGVEALQHYKWPYNTAIQDYKPIPVHDAASHGADAFRGLATRHYPPRLRKPKVEPDIDVYDIQIRRARKRAGLGRGGYS